MEMKLVLLVLAACVCYSYAKSCPTTCSRVERYDVKCGKSSWSWRKCTKYRTKVYTCSKPCPTICPTEGSVSVPHPKDESKFYECEDSVPLLKTCPAHSTFNDIAQTCVGYPCNTMDGYLQSDDADKSRYLICLAGVKVIEIRCPTGTLFNGDSKVCQ